MSKLLPVTVKAVKKCMEGIASAVGIKLEKELGTLIGLMFDGWTHAGVHYIGLYAVYEAEGELRVPLLGLPPLTDGTHTADAHAQLFENVLDVYHKTNDMVGFLVGDNCNTNQCIANKMGIPLVGCASHRFNLAVNKFLAPYESLLGEVNDLMVALRQENNFAELKKHTELLPVKRNVTRWSSTFTMVQRYIRSDIQKVEAVEELIPTEVRLLFDALVAEYPVMAEHLKATARIVHTPAFESGIVHLISGHGLSSAEAEAHKPFEKRSSTRKKRKDRDEDYASLLLRSGGKRARADTTTDYLPLVKLIPPTSNKVERLLSQCKLVMTPQRRCIPPANFEQLSFLRANRSMWDLITVASVCEKDSA
uniref:Uncharacterized protein n=1 Tax=Phytophthora ramorum TaxID=164328 RepID=H3GUY7_PHYRM